LGDKKIVKEKARLTRMKSTALGLARQPIRRVLSTQGKGTPQEKLERIIGHDGVTAFDFAMSPADFDCTVGLPDGAMPKSIPLTLKMEFTMSTTTTSPNWNLAILSLPSIDFPVICIGYPTGGSPWKFFNSFGNIVALTPTLSEGTSTTMINYAGVIYSVYIPQWPATQIDTVRGPTVAYNSAQGNFTAPAGWPAMTYYNSDGSLSGANTVKGFLGIGTTQSNAIQSWRCCGMSVTTELVASALTNEGMVTCRPLSRSARQGSMTGIMQAVYDQTGGTAVSAVSSYVSCPGFSLDNLPQSRSDLVAAELSYSNVAHKGSYVISRYMGGAKTFLDTDVDRGCLSLSYYSVNAGGDEKDANFLVSGSINPLLNQGTGGTDGLILAAPIVLGVDQNWTPTMTIYEGIDKAASVDVKLIMGVQCTATSNGSYASVGKIVAQPSLMFPQVLASTMKAIPPGFEAAENWEWADVGRWLKTGLDVVAAIAPFLLPLL